MRGKMETKSYAFYKERILKDKNYKAGRKGDVEAARHFVTACLSLVIANRRRKNKSAYITINALHDGYKQKFDNLCLRVGTEHNVVFLPLPSSSGQNLIASSLANNLKDFFMRNGVNSSQIPNIGEYIYSTSGQSICQIDPTLRWSLGNRNFDKHPDTFNRFLKKVHLKDGTPKSIYITDDMTSTGASAFAFKRYLEAHNLSVSGIVTLAGRDIYANADQIKQELQTALKQNNLNFSPDDIMKVSVPAEVRTLISFLMLPPDEQDRRRASYQLMIKSSAARQGTVKEPHVQKILSSLQSTRALIEIPFKERMELSR